MNKIIQKTVTVWEVDGKQFNSKEEAEKKHNVNLIDKLTVYCNCTHEESYEDSLQNILILLRDNNITSKNNIQNLVDFIEILKDN